MRWLLMTLLVVTMVSAQPALTFPPPKVNAPTAEQMAQIKEKTAQLRKALSSKNDATLQLYLKAAEYIVRHGEFFGKQAEWTLTILDDGLKLAAEGKVPAVVPGATNVRAYRSKIDGSLQPFAVTLPADHGKDANKRWPLHVVLHGRDGNLTEVAFLHRNRGRKAAKDLDHIVLEVYGRGNNAYRWAGEEDIWEAMLGTSRFARTTPGATVLRGFSMGGAGTWHLGLHFSDYWRVIGPGAGFTTTKGYANGLSLTPVQEKTLHIYDAVDYAENAFNVPIVAYSGADDPQKKAADNIEAALGKLGLKMTHLISPKTGHTVPPAYQKKLAEQYASYTLKPKDALNPADKLVFVTYTLKYPDCYWISLQGLEQHYERTRVEAQRVGKDGADLKTTNVRAMKITASEVTIDGQTLKGTAPLQVRKTAGKWQVVDPNAATTGLEKVPGLTGPIDDAFTKPFLCVRGTGTAWNVAPAAYAEADLQRFGAEWSKFLRGDLRIKDDKDVTDDDIKNYALILFGDPGSNSVLAKVLPKLPLTWTKEKLTWNGKEYDAATHVPAFIQPNPLNPQAYVVINSGHTFHADAFQGTNALLYPRLGDHALLRLTDVKKPLAMEVVASGLFDEFWKFKPEKP